MVKPILRARIINFYRLSDTSESGAATVSMNSLAYPYNSTTDFWFDYGKLHESFIKMGRVYIEAAISSSDQFPGK